MKPKKNPNIAVKRNGSLYFVIGLAFVLFVIWRFMEIKIYDRESDTVQLVNLEKPVLQDIPITQTLNTPPPPPPAAPEVIQIVEDTEEIVETIIESTETDQNEVIKDPVVRVEDIEVAEEEEDISVPFAVIEKVPVFPGCTGDSNEELKTCFQLKIQAHIKKHFKYPDIAREMGIKGKVYVLFVINSNGMVTNIQTRGPDRLLEKEAARIIGLLPKMTPGKQRGKEVKVPYSIPINFTLM
ncbi:TonB family protein [Leptobacterium flavescens]|uniref:TonB family protein n=1 Tax=Leptobacterium flavescens TaxID=472055 RepID=A0A6P0ULE0_9FLAO|nr:energy transducer TonB [Leptobacterium flavescens]NER11873.1 TonB family protein [Leptobacterium flavescens]